MVYSSIIFVLVKSEIQMLKLQVLMKRRQKELRIGHIRILSIGLELA